MSCILLYIRRVKQMLIWRFVYSPPAGQVIFVVVSLIYIAILVNHFVDSHVEITNARYAELTTMVKEHPEVKDTADKLLHDDGYISTADFYKISDMIASEQPVARDVFADTLRDKNK